MDEHNYSESSGKLECAICSEHIFDPRVLPCGHSYCGGKSKTCLNALKVENGLKCALCNDVHEIEISSLKPLFGIRDIVHRSYTQSPCPQEQYVDHVDGIEASSSASPANKMMGPKCENHFCNPIKFWCVECSQFICETCFEETHQSHSLKSYRCYLQDTVKEKLCSIHSVEAIIEENVEKCGKKRNILQTEMSEIDEFQTLLAEKRSLMTVVKENKEKLRMFGDGTMTDIDRSLVDTFMSVTSSICDLQFPRSRDPFRQNKVTSLFKFMLGRHLCLDTRVTSEDFLKVGMYKLDLSLTRSMPFPAHLLVVFSCLPTEDQTMKLWKVKFRITLRLLNQNVPSNSLISTFKVAFDPKNSNRRVRLIDWEELFKTHAGWFKDDEKTLKMECSVSYCS